MGRKRNANVKRTPSGRRSRAKDSYQENADQIQTRQRLFGLSEQDARDQRASTFIGRLCLGKQISPEQYEASQRYLEVREAYQRAMKTPDALRTSSGGGGDGESDGYEDWCRNAVKKYDAAMKAVMDEQCHLNNRGKNLFAALDYLVCRDEEHWHLVGDCRQSLNALSHHFTGQKTRRVDTATQIAA